MLKTSYCMHIHVLNIITILFFSPRRNNQRRAKHLISYIQYSSDSSDESDVLPPRSLRSIKGRTPIRKKSVRKMVSSEDEESESVSTAKVDERETQDSVSTVKVDEEEAASGYSIMKNLDNEVTTSSSSKLSSSEEEIDISIPDQVVVNKKKHKSKISSDFSSIITETSESNDFFSVEGDTTKKNESGDESEKKNESVESDEVINDSDELKSDDNNHETFHEVQNSEEKIDESDIEMTEPLPNHIVGENVKVNEKAEKTKKVERGSCCAVLRRKKKSERLMKKRKELTPCVIIDLIRKKNHPLNRYQHLFTHKTMAKLTDKEFNFLKNRIMMYQRKNVKNPKRL